MNKKFALAWLAVFVVWMGGSFVVHGVLLHPDYVKLPNLFRPEADARQYFPLMILAHVLMSGAFVWIYSRRGEAVARSGDPLWLRHRAAYGGARVHDLLRRAAHAGHARGQADRVRRNPASYSRSGGGLPVSQQQSGLRDRRRCTNLVYPLQN
jgi:hypothetical protein